MTRAAEVDATYGCVEILERRGDELHVAGWIARSAGAFDGVAVATPAGTRYAATAVDRPDLAHNVARIPRARTAGYTAVVPAQECERAGRHELTLLGLCGGATVARRTVAHVGSPSASATPPTDLVRRVQNHPSPALFHTAGLCAAGDILQIVEPHVARASIRRVLEFGCGCGRLTAHLARAFPAAVIRAVDADPDMVAWMRAHGPAVECARCAALPPLDLADASFDLVVAAHVFEDQTLAAQAAWAAELARVLAPGGHAFVTTHGPHAAWIVGEDDVERALERDGHFDGLADADLATRRPRPYHCAAFQTAATTRRIWSGPFEELAHVAGGMDGAKDAWLWRRTRDATSPA